MIDDSRTSISVDLPPSSTASQDDPELPTYSPRSRTQLTEQTFKLEDTKSRAWLWLKVKSRSRENQLPLFFDRDTVSGTVEVDFDKADGAKAVTIAVSDSHLREQLRSMASKRGVLRLSWLRFSVE